MSDEWHVLPNGDLIEHTSAGDGCVCGPDVEAFARADGSFGAVITHHSLDGRELNERGANDD